MRSCRCSVCFLPQEFTFFSQYSDYVAVFTDGSKPAEYDIPFYKNSKLLFERTLHEKLSPLCLLPTLRSSPSLGRYGCPNPEIPRDLYSLPVYPLLCLLLIHSIPRRQARELSMRSCFHSACFFLLMDSPRPRVFAVCGDPLDGNKEIKPDAAAKFLKKSPSQALLSASVVTHHKSNKNKTDKNETSNASAVNLPSDSCRGNSSDSESDISVTSAPEASNPQKNRARSKSE
ncbi:hypothetical protein AVEN_9572-1 [Araneus ventricosus]|uniref:Uncharacterized protein n=1 Tax=Araneus ventricosus TaxID=182803 RepID=A0A4Y2H927_ARAVE|nr:hypothetical protein AVEN_9572-1 [Araneus ventricosus]